MSKGRLEAFSDGVIAIIITIMVLEMRAPEGHDLSALTPLWPVFLSYVLSFVHLGTYWNNHHHMLHTAKYVSGPILWANLHLLFWLSLVPFVTSWMGEAEFAPFPVALYGAVMLMSGAAYNVLSRALIARHGRDSALATAVGRDAKGMVSLALYVIAVPMSFFSAGMALAIYVVVEVMWLVPDRRIEHVLAPSD